MSSSQSGLQSEFEDSQGYTEKPCLKKKKSLLGAQSFTGATFHPSTEEAEEADLWEFEASLVYIDGVSNTDKNHLMSKYET